MKVEALRTRKVTVGSISLEDLLDESLPSFQSGSVLAVTSKVIAICQGRTVKASEVGKQELINKEADLYLPPELNKYGVTLSIKNSRLIPSAGIDESNSDGYYVLWPSDPQQVANTIRQYLINRFACRNVGVVITDSTTTPLRWGVTGICVAHSGFSATNNLIGTPDIFGRPLRITKVNVADGLACAAVLVMGEGNEQTPLSVISEVPFVNFQDRVPSMEELDAMKIEPEDDLYGTVLTSVPWREGGGTNL